MQKKYEAESNESIASSELLNEVIERINDGFVALDSSWHYTYVNTRAARMLQRETPADLIGKHIWSEYPEGVGQPFYQAYHKAFETQEPVIFEDYYPPWDLWFENRIYPSPKGLTIYFTDITVRKKSEENLRQIAAVFASTKDGIAITDLEMRILRVNQSFTDITGYEESEVLGQYLHQSKSNKDDNLFYENIWSQLRKSGSWQGEIRNSRKNGEVYPERLGLNSMKDEKGCVVGYVAVISDISEQQQIQRQLQQAQKLEAIGQLTSGVAHDFNNILTSIMGFSMLASKLASKLVDDISKKTLDKYIEKVYQAGERSRDLIEQLLTFSQTIATNAKPVMLEPLVKEVTSLLKPSFPASIHLQSDIDTNVSNIMIDPGHFHQILMNLCINARDALNDKGLIEVKVREVNGIYEECASCHEKVKGHFVAVEVSDNGSGIEPFEIVRIFDPFFTTKDIGKGTGMGLSMVHSLMHEYGGHILLESEVDKGSTFCLLFPAVSEEAVAVVEVERPEYIEPLSELNKGHILVVDDDESVAIFVSDLLVTSGYQVTTMTNSKEAYSLFNKNPNIFDLVIIDLVMPAITGVELIEKILKVQPELPIILCTGYRDKISEESARAVGARGYLLKPFTHRELLMSVNNLLSISQKKQES